MSVSMDSGVSDGAKRLTTFPFLSMRNFVKFHLMLLLPSTPPF